MAPAYRTIAGFAAAAAVFVGGVSYADSTGTDEPVGPVAAAGPTALATSRADAAPWLAATANGIVDASGLAATNDLVPTRLPAGWRQLARGVYATSPRPGDGPVVLVLRSWIPLAEEPEALARTVRREARTWAGVAGVSSSVAVAPMFGGEPGIARSHLAARPLPEHAGRTSISRAEVRRGRVGSQGYLVVGLDDSSRPASGAAVARIVDSLRPR